CRFVAGAEIAGLGRAVGAGVAGFAPGDAVLASAALGGFAELALAPAGSAWHLPEGMSFEEGAALPIIYPTSYAGLVFRADLRAGEDLLVHAAAGGVGIAAVPIRPAPRARGMAAAGGPAKPAVAAPHGAPR